MVTARVALTAVFFDAGALFASWTSRIPAVSARVHASDGVLGLVLLAPALGAVICAPWVGRLLPGRSTRRFSQVALAALMAAIVLPGLARSPLALAGALLLAGIANSTLDVSMNAHGVLVERELGRPVLSSMHAAYSFGGFAGAGVGALAAALAVAPVWHLAFASLLFGAPVLVASRRMLAADREGAHDGAKPRLRGLPLSLIALGVACFCCLVAEGGAADWSAKLVHDDLAGSAALGAVAFASFSVGMACGRLLTDRLWTRWGAVRVLRRSGLLAAAGLAAGLAAGTGATAVIGFALLGLGLSGVVPTLFRAGAHQPGVPPGTGIAATAALGYTGMLVGPPIIGGLAQLTSLRLACGLLVLSGVLVFALAGAAHESDRGRR